MFSSCLPTHRPQILIVEDDPLVLEVLEAALSREGYTYETARTGEQAIERAYRLQPDAVLLDVDLPGQSGYLVAAKLKMARPSPKVLFLTALPRGRSDRMAVFVRADGIMHKPFTVKNLVSTLDRLLTVSQAA